MEMYLLQLFISIWMVSGLCNGEYNCLTWTSDNTDISLICRLNNFLLPVSFIDPNEKEQAKCTFNTSVSNCLHHHKNGNIRADMQMHKVVFVIKGFNKLNVNGKWACTQGKKRFTTIVSTNKGLLETTNLYIDGFIQSANNIGLKCFSCREPEWKSAEFLFNNRTEDSLRYDEMSKQCFHSKGLCHPNSCSCSKNGNEFIRIFPVDIHRYETTFSCKMHFVDFMSLRFLMIASVIFNGTDFIPLTTITEITKAAELDKEVDISRNGTKTTVPTKIEVGPTYQFHVKWVAVVCIIFTMFVVIAVIVVCLYIRKLRKKTREDYHTKKLHVTENKNNYVNDVKEKSPLIETKDNSGGKDFVNEETQTFQPTGEDAVTNVQREYRTSMQQDFEIIKWEEELEITRQKKEKLQKSLRLKKVMAQVQKEQEELRWLKEEEMSFDAEYSSSSANVKTVMTKENVDTIQSSNAVTSANEIDQSNEIAVKMKTDEIEPSQEITKDDKETTKTVQKLIEHSRHVDLQMMHLDVNEDDLDSNVMQQSQVAVKLQGQTIENVSEFDQKYLEGHRISGIAVTEDDLVLLCDCSGAKVLLFDKRGIFSRTITVPYIPWDIDIIPSAKMAVCSCKTDNIIQFINTWTFNMEKSIKLFINIEGGIACSNDNIFVGGKNTIFVLDHNGSYLWGIPDVSNRDILIRYLSFNEEYLYFTDCETHDIIQLNQEEEDFRFRIFELLTPMKVVFDRKGIIYCLGSLSNNLVRALKQGSLLDILLTKDNGIHCPWTLCFNNDFTRLYISNNQGKSVLSCALSS